MNGSYGLIAEQGFFCILVTLAFIFLGVTINLYIHKDEEKLSPIDTSKYNITENGNVIKEKNNE